MEVWFRWFIFSTGEPMLIFRGVNHWKVTWRWKNNHFWIGNTVDLHSWWIFQPVMLVFFGGCRSVSFLPRIPIEQICMVKLREGNEHDKTHPSLKLHREFSPENQFWVVVSNIFDCHPELGIWSNLTNIFQMDWNHDLEFCWKMFFFCKGARPIFRVFAVSFREGKWLINY